MGLFNFVMLLFVEKNNNLSQSSRLKLLAPGNITDSKGGLLIKQLASDEEFSGSLEIHILGKIQASLGITKSSSIVCHGGYERQDFPELVSSLSPDVGLILSVWPETYCHTLTELWMCKIPVIGTNLGAVGDRLRKCGGGWVVDPTYFALKVLIRRILADRQLINNAKSLIESRSEYDLQPFVRSVHSMARDYMSLYRSYCLDLC